MFITILLTLSSPYLDVVHSSLIEEIFCVALHETREARSSLRWGNSPEVKNSLLQETSCLNPYKSLVPNSQQCVGVQLTDLSWRCSHILTKLQFMTSAAIELQLSNTGLHSPQCLPFTYHILHWDVFTSYFFNGLFFWRLSIQRPIKHWRQCEKGDRKVQRTRNSG